MRANGFVLEFRRNFKYNTDCGFYQKMRNRKTKLLRFHAERMAAICYEIDETFCGVGQHSGNGCQMLQQHLVVEVTREFLF